MTQENIRLELLQNNDEVVQLTVTDPNNLVLGVPQPFDHTPGVLSVSVVVKTSRQTLDSDPATKTYVATKTVPAQGICQFTVPAADNAVAARTWWRADVIQSAPASRRTVICGPAEVMAV